MAKSKSFFGLRRGSTKSMTFQVLNGGQITKDRVSDVKNPRTQSQMVQRMIMATAGAGYKAMRAICDHSFEGVSYGQKSYSEFMKLNVNAMVNDIKAGNGDFSYNPYGDTNLYASPFILSRGSLKNPNQILNFANDEEVWEVKVIKNTVDTTTMTVDEMLNAFGLQLGDYLTACGIVKFTNETSWHFWWVRFHVKAGGSTIASETDFNAIFDAEASQEVADYLINENGFEVDFDWQNVEDDQIYGTTILSRKSNNRWLRSNASIIFPGSPVNNPTAAQALATYPVGTDYILNGANIKGGGGIAPTPVPTILDDGLYAKGVAQGCVIKVQNGGVWPLYKGNPYNGMVEWYSIMGSTGNLSLAGSYSNYPMADSDLNKIKAFLDAYGGRDNYTYYNEGELYAELTLSDLTILE